MPPKIPGAVQRLLPELSTICFIPQIRRILHWNMNRMGEHDSGCQTIRPVSPMSRNMSQICDNYVLGHDFRFRHAAVCKARWNFRRP